MSAHMEGKNKKSGLLPTIGGDPLFSPKRHTQQDLHDTGHVRWYPMRVTYNRELLVKACFDELGIECFVPMKHEMDEEGFSGNERMVPAIHNLIFVHSTQERITALKMERIDFAPLRYMMDHTSNGVTKIMTVPDTEMDNFIKAVSVRDHPAFVVDDSDYFSKIGKMVRFKEGQFKDVVGVVKRIKRNRCVVVRIQGVAAAIIANVPNRFVEEI